MVEECCRRSRDVDNIARLSSLVERLERENQRLRSSPGVAVTEEVGRLRRENEGLRAQVEDVRGNFGTKLSDRYNAKERATSKVTRSYEDMRHDLQAVRQQHQKTKKEKEELNSELAHLRRQNKSLQDQLETSRGLLQRSERQRELLVERLNLKEKSDQSKSSKAAKSGDTARKFGRIDEITCPVKLRLLLKESLRRQRTQSEIQRKLESQIAALRDPGTKTDTMTLPELRRKFHQQQLVIQTMATERDILNRYLELTSGPQGKQDAMDQLALCKEVTAENTELKLRLRSLTNQLPASPHLYGTEDNAAVVEEEEEEVEEEDFGDSAGVRALLSSITEEREEEERSEKGGAITNGKDIVLEEFFHEENLGEVSETKQNGEAIERAEVTEPNSVQFLTSNITFSRVDELSQLF